MRRILWLLPFATLIIAYLELSNLVNGDSGAFTMLVGNKKDAPGLPSRIVAGRLTPSAPPFWISDDRLLMVATFSGPEMSLYDIRTNGSFERIARVRTTATCLDRNDNRVLIHELDEADGTPVWIDLDSLSRIPIEKAEGDRRLRTCTDRGSIHFDESGQHKVARSPFEGIIRGEHGTEIDVHFHGSKIATAAFSQNFSNSDEAVDSSIYAFSPIWNDTTFLYPNFAMTSQRERNWERPGKLTAWAFDRRGMTKLEVPWGDEFARGAYRFIYRPGLLIAALSMTERDADEGLWRLQGTAFQQIIHESVSVDSVSISPNGCYILYVGKDDSAPPKNVIKVIDACTHS